MKSPTLIAAFLFSTLTATAAMADGAGCGEPMEGWAPREAVQGVAKKNGWTVREIKTDDGCWVVKGKDETGRAISVDLEPDTLMIVNFDHDGPAPAAATAAPKSKPAPSAKAK